MEQLWEKQGNFAELKYKFDKTDFVRAFVSSAFENGFRRIAIADFLKTKGCTFPKGVKTPKKEVIIIE